MEDSAASEHVRNQMENISFFNLILASNFVVFHSILVNKVTDALKLNIKKKIIVLLITSYPSYHKHVYISFDVLNILYKYILNIKNWVAKIGRKKHNTDL